MKYLSKLGLLCGLILSLDACTGAPDDVRYATVDGHQIAYRVLGSGRPVVVMIPGLGDGMASFQTVAGELAKDAMVIVYDRAGYGGSASIAGPRDAQAIEHELSGLLAQSGVAPPYVLVGHSIGGLFAEYFAAKHADLVSGLILEESRPADFTQRCEAARAGMCTPPALLVKLMPSGAQGEFAAMGRTMSEVIAAGQVTGKPVLILSKPMATKPSRFDTLWTKAQADLAARYAGSRHLIAGGGGHYLHRDQQTWFVETARRFVGELGD